MDMYSKSPQCTLQISYNFVNYTSIKLEEGEGTYLEQGEKIQNK